MPDLSIPEGGRDMLTPLVASILREVGEAGYTRLVVSGQPPAASQALRGVSSEQLFARPIKHADDAAAALAGLWLWHDALDACHRIVQDIPSPTGSLWHAIMHRREGDFSNAKYWYNRCQAHPVHKWMGSVASSLVGEKPDERQLARVLRDGWDPLAFVDLVESVHGHPTDPRHAMAVRLQRAEWEGLFDYCVRAAVESDQNRLDDWDRRAGILGAGM